MIGSNAITLITVPEMDGIEGKNVTQAQTVLYHTFIQPAVVTKPVVAAAASVLTHTEKNVCLQTRNGPAIKKQQ